MEALSRMLPTIVDRGWKLLSSFPMGSSNNDELLVSHLLFTEDALIFCEANLDHLCHLRCQFLHFEVVSRLKINLDKPLLVPVGAVENIGSLASILGCKVSYLPMKYLGLPLGASFKAKLIWNGAIEKIECHWQVGSGFICQKVVGSL